VGRTKKCGSRPAEAKNINKTTRLARLTPADSRKFCLRLLGCQLGCTIVYCSFKKCAHFGDWCFHKQKTTTITVNFPKIIELHLNSSCQCIQLAMRHVNRREKNQLRQREKLRIICVHSEIRTHDLRVNPQQTSCAFTLYVIPARHHTLRAIYVNLLYTNMLFIATAIYDCANMYTTVHGKGYSSSRAVSTL
jgi:hypothetical protein